MAKRKTTSINKRRKGMLALILPWLKRFGLWLAILITVIWLGAWIILSGAGSKAIDWAKQQIITATANAGFVVEDLLLEGRTHADAAFIKALLNVQAGDPLFGVSPKDARQLLEETEWIARARVERRLPGTLYIQLTERIPTALWQEADKLHLVDENGNQIKTDRLERFAELIMISGKGAPQQVGALLSHLSAEKNIQSRARSAQRISDRRWDIRLDNGLILHLPEDKNIGYAITRAAKAQAEEGLFDIPNLESVDFRFDDKIVLKTKPGSVQDYKKSKSQSGGA